MCYKIAGMTAAECDTLEVDGTVQMQTVGARWKGFWDAPQCSPGIGSTTQYHIILIHYPIQIHMYFICIKSSLTPVTIPQTRHAA